jgi:hypothetical protein
MDSSHLSGKKFPINAKIEVWYFVVDARIGDLP